ncbi:MAG TPA: alpha/beta fold hydrolase [Candidatus Moranbacteria bacterium]|nr:alpha/beta fold hydrolase [Candidatus Moranbacteria bacterium]
MKKEILSKKIIFLNLFIFLFFAFSFNLVQASQNIPDICESGIEEKFQFLCEKDQLLDPRELFGFEEKSDNKAKKESFGVMAVSSIEGKSDGSDEIIIGGNEEWNENKVFDHKIITIEPGAQLEIKAGVTITLKDSIINVEGKFITSGTKEKTVIIKSSGEESDSGFSIISDLDDKDGQINEILMKNTDISGNNNVLGAVITKKTKLDMEECSIHDNVIGVVMAENDSNEKKVNRSKFYGNQIDAVSYYELGGETLAPDFRYNWWGENSSKIEQYCNDEYGCIAYHDKIFGLINIRPWFVSEDFFDPVVIVPGIMGSEEKDGAWKIDPVYHIYDDLYNEFIEEGFGPEKNLFTFPYEWRNSNRDNALLLRDKIAEIKQATGLPKVDVVAHSMGGLLAREYIESDYYQDDVSQLITLGTPQNGAPEAYIKWEAGEFTFSFVDMYLKHKFSQEAEENGYDDIFHYIRQRPMTSVQELLPNYSYLYEALEDDIQRTYPNNYPINEFLDNLNSEERKEKLKKVLLYKIVGNVEDDESTISSFSVLDGHMGEYWEHGYPQGFEIPIGDRGIKWKRGDRTVPFESARSENIPAEESIEINAAHRELPTEAQKNVLGILTAKSPGKETRRNPIKDLLFISVYSPVDIQIENSEGKKVGKNFATGNEINEIEDAYYSGAGALNEFLTIPIFGSDEKDFKIITQGTEEGVYKIEISRITESEGSSEAKEINAAISGTAVLNQEESVDLKVTENEIIVESDKTPPEISIVSPEENKTYLNSGTIPVNYGISDNKSPKEKITDEAYLDEDILENKTIDLAFLNLGKHKIKIIAKDEAGNIGQKEISFTTETSVDAMINNTAYYYRLGMMRKQDKTVLTAHLEIIRQLQEMIKMIEKNRFMKNRTKEMLVANLKRQINFYLDWLSFYAKMRSNPNTKNGINPEVGKLLIENFNFLKYNF